MTLDRLKLIESRFALLRAQRDGNRPLEKTCASLYFHYLNKLKETHAK